MLGSRLYAPMPIALAVAEPQSAAGHRQLRICETTAPSTLPHLPNSFVRILCPLPYVNASVGEISAEAHRSSFCRSREPSAWCQTLHWNAEHERTLTLRHPPASAARQASKDGGIAERSKASKPSWHFDKCCNSPPHDDLKKELARTSNMILRHCSTYCVC